MDCKKIGAQLVQSISFEVEAVPQDNDVEISNVGKMTPLNVKVRVRKKENGIVSNGTISIPRHGQLENPLETLRLANSDITIMSFNMLMDADLKKQVEKKPRRSFFGRFLGTRGEKGEDKHLPIVADDKENMDTTSESQVFKLKKLNALGKAEDTSPYVYTKKDKFFGKCKPGGCLDPPFGEDKYAYQPQKLKHLKALKPPAGNLVDTQDSEITATADSNKPDDVTDKKKVADTSSEIKIAKKDIPKDGSILSLYKGDQKNNLQENDSVSIITYPPALSSSGMLLGSEYNEKHVSQRTSGARQSGKSFNEFSTSYYSPPRDSKDSSGKAERSKSHPINDTKQDQKPDPKSLRSRSVASTGENPNADTDQTGINNKSSRTSVGVDVFKVGVTGLAAAVGMTGIGLAATSVIKPTDDKNDLNKIPDQHLHSQNSPKWDEQNVSKLPADVSEKVASWDTNKDVIITSSTDVDNYSNNFSDNINDNRVALAASAVGTEIAATSVSKTPDDESEIKQIHEQHLVPKNSLKQNEQYISTHDENYLNKIPYQHSDSQNSPKRDEQTGISEKVASWDINKDAPKVHPDTNEIKISSSDVDNKNKTINDNINDNRVTHGAAAAGTGISVTSVSKAPDGESEIKRSPDQHFASQNSLLQKDQYISKLPTDDPKKVASQDINKDVPKMHSDANVSNTNSTDVDNHIDTINDNINDNRVALAAAAAGVGIAATNVSKAPDDESELKKLSDQHLDQRNSPKENDQYSGQFQEDPSEKKIKKNIPEVHSHAKITHTTSMGVYNHSNSILNDKVPNAEKMSDIAVEEFPASEELQNEMVTETNYPPSMKDDDPRKYIYGFTNDNWDNYDAINENQEAPKEISNQESEKYQDSAVFQHDTVIGTVAAITAAGTGSGIIAAIKEPSPGGDNNKTKRQQLSEHASEGILYDAQSLYLQHKSVSRDDTMNEIYKSPSDIHASSHSHLDENAKINGVMPDYHVDSIANEGKEEESEKTNTKEVNEMIEDILNAKESEVNAVSSIIIKKSMDNNEESYPENELGQEITYSPFESQRGYSGKGFFSTSEKLENNNLTKTSDQERISISGTDAQGHNIKVDNYEKMHEYEKYDLSSQNEVNAGISSTTVKLTDEVKDSIFLNLAFQTSKDENQTTVKTRDTSNYSDDNLLLVKSLIKSGRKVVVPISPRHVMNIEIKDASQTPIDTKSNTPRSIKSIAKLESGNSGFGSKRIALGDPHTALTVVYNKDLIPLQILIKNLRHDIEELAKQQMKLRERLAAKKVKFGQSYCTKNCRCVRHSCHKI